MKHSNTHDAIEIDDDSPLKPPQERALWCAVLMTFVEDIDLVLAELKKAPNELERMVLISCLDNCINEMIHPYIEIVCEFANVPHDDFVDGLLKRVEGVK